MPQSGSRRGCKSSEYRCAVGRMPATRPAFARRALRVVLHPNAAVRAALTAAGARVRLESAGFGRRFRARAPPRIPQLKRFP